MLVVLWLNRFRTVSLSVVEFRSNNAFSFICCGNVDSFANVFWVYFVVVSIPFLSACPNVVICATI